MAVKVKICGITNRADALCAVKSGADALGFVFAESPRRVSCSAAARIIRILPPFITAVGVFVNAPRREVLSVLKHVPLDCVQLHGEESDGYCAFFQKHCRVIKTIRVNDRNPAQMMSRYRHANAFLFDTGAKHAYGGTGRTFNWGLLKDIPRDRPWIIAGGLTPRNVRRVIAMLRPYAVDAASGVENEPGKKNSNLLRRFIQAAS